MNGLAGRLDPGLLERFRRAGPAIAWRAGAGRRPSGRVAHLHDEEAFVLVSEGPDGALVSVDSGPVGALVLLLEIDARGPEGGTWADDATVAPFPQGALAASWGPLPTDGRRRRAIPFGDLVGLARYALA